MNNKITYPMRLFIGLGALCYVIFTALVVYSEIDADYIDSYAELMKQRASFHIAGSVVDDEGMPCTNVIMNITERRFDPKTLETRVSKKNKIIDSSFDISVSDATSIEIGFEKEGYHGASSSYHFKELFNAKMSSQENAHLLPIEQQVEFYRNLRWEDTNVVFRLERITGSPAQEIKRPLRMRVSGNAVNDRVTVQGMALNSEGFDLALELDVSQNSTALSRLYMVTPASGGVIVTSPAEQFHKMYVAPIEGYSKRVDISDMNRTQRFSLYLKSPNGEYAKLTVGTFYFNKERSQATVIFDNIGIQTNGTRNLETVRK